MGYVKRAGVGAMAIALSLGLSPAVWAHHKTVNNPVYTDHQNQRDHLIGTRPELRNDIGAAKGNLRGAKNDWKTNVKPALKAEGVHGKALHAQKNAYLAPYKASVRGAKEKMGETNALIRYHGNQMHKIEKQGHEHHDEGRHLGNCFGFC